MLGFKLMDRIRCTEIRRRTKVTDVIQHVTKQKAKWAGHVARLNDNRWTKRTTDWIPRDMTRSRGRQPRRWRDDLVEHFGPAWLRTARDRTGWKKLTEGYIQQWIDLA